MYRQVCFTFAVICSLFLRPGLIHGQDGFLKPGQAFSVRIPAEPEAPISVKLTPTHAIQQPNYIFSATDRLPGTSHTVDYGRFFHHVRAFSAENQSLAVHRIGTNQWQIYDGAQFAYLTYEVALNEMESVLKDQTLSGTRRREYALLPFLTISGWLHGHENGSQHLQIEQPANWQRISNLSADVDSAFNESSFFRMGASVFVLGTEFVHSAQVAFGAPLNTTVYVENSFPNNAPAIFPQLPQLASVLFESAPFESYYLFLEFVAPSYHRRSKSAFQINATKNGQHLIVLSEQFTGKAVQDMLLSHYLQAWLSDKRYFKARVEDFYSQRYAYSDWLMEGVSQYLAARLLVQSGAHEPGDLLGKISSWIMRESQNQNELAGTTTAPIFSNGYAHSKPDRSSRGALIAFLLDVQILYQSRGFERLDKGITGLEKSFQKSGEKMPVTRLPDIIRTATGISVDSFFHSYVEQNTALPLEKAFTSLGIHANSKMEASSIELHFLPEKELSATVRQLRDWWLKKIDLN